MVVEEERVERTGLGGKAKVVRQAAHLYYCKQNKTNLDHLLDEHVDLFLLLAASAAFVEVVEHLAPEATLGG